MSVVNWLKKSPIAHRGLWDEKTPENSLSAFRKAVDAGIPIELDIQLLPDDVFVVFHDRSLLRMTGINQEIDGMLYEDTQKFILKNSTDRIPRLEDVLRIVDGRVPIVIEMKYHVSGRKKFIHELHAVLCDYKGMFALSSFDPFLVREAKRMFPSILCGQNFTDHAQHGRFIGRIRKYTMYFLWVMSAHVPDFFVCHASLLSARMFEKITCWYGVMVLTWGIKDREQYLRIAHVIDNEIFDGDSYMR